MNIINLAFLLRDLVPLAVSVYLLRQDVSGSLERRTSLEATRGQ
jgi:hypothetical protein